MNHPGLLGRWTPGFIASVDRDRRTVKVRIPGVTDGAAQFPEADVCYPIGVKSTDSEIPMADGDPVWLDFVAGNPKYPVVIGYRNPEAGNEVGIWRLRQETIELLANTDMTLQAVDGTLTIQAGTLVKLKAPALEFEGPAAFKGEVSMDEVLTLKQGFSNTGGNLVDKGVKVGLEHNHTVTSLGSPTSAVNPS